MTTQPTDLLTAVIRKAVIDVIKEVLPAEIEKLTPEPEQRKLLSEKEAAEYLGVSRTSLCRWRLEGEGPTSLRLQGVVRYRESDLNKWLNERAA